MYVCIYVCIYVYAIKTFIEFIVAKDYCIITHIQRERDIKGERKFEREREGDNVCMTEIEWQRERESKFER